MISISKTTIWLLFVILSIVNTIEVESCINLSDSSTFDDKVINISRTYYINDNVDLCRDSYSIPNIDTGISINCSNCYLDCNGAVINGTVGEGTGIYIRGENNVNITNCTVYEYSSSIIMHNANNNTLIDNTLMRHDSFGINSQNSSSNLIERNEISGTGNYAISIHTGSDFNTIRQNNCTGDSQGIVVDASFHNSILNNTVTALENNGILLEHGASFNNISFNLITYNAIGIQLHSSSNNSFSYNRLLYNNLGLVLVQDSDWNGFSYDIYTNNSNLVSCQTPGLCYEILFYGAATKDDTYLPQHNSFNDVGIYEGEAFISNHLPTEIANNFYNLTIGYNSTTGKVNWHFLNITTGNLNSENLLLDPSFISMNATVVSQFNMSANLTLDKNESCDSIGHYRLEGFPKNASSIINEGSILSPSYHSCSDFFNLATFSVSDFAGYSIGSSQSDIDKDGLSDEEDALLYNESNVTIAGITNLNITINGSTTDNLFNGKQEVRFYDSSVLLINFSHNFSESNLDLSKITILKQQNSLVINASGQLQGNKTIYLVDNNFASLCVKDAEITSDDEISNLCNGANETDFTSCLGSSLILDGITCTDLGSSIRIENLRHSGVRGTPQSSVTTSTTASSGSSSGHNTCGNGICTSLYGEDCKTCPHDCGDCNGGIIDFERIDNNSLEITDKKDYRVSSNTSTKEGQVQQEKGDNEDISIRAGSRNDSNFWLIAAIFGSGLIISYLSIRSCKKK